MGHSTSTTSGSPPVLLFLSLRLRSTSPSLLRSQDANGLSLCPTSKQALGSHEYIQYCRKFDIDIRLQLMEQKSVRSDLARTVRGCGGVAEGDSEHI